MLRERFYRKRDITDLGPEAPEQCYCDEVAQPPLAKRLRLCDFCIEEKRKADECKPCWCGDPLCIRCKRTWNAEQHFRDLRS